MDQQDTGSTTEIVLIDSKANNSGDVSGTVPNDERDIIPAVHYKPIIDWNKQMEQHHSGEKTKTGRLKHSFKVGAHLR